MVRCKKERRGVRLKNGCRTYGKCYLKYDNKLGYDGIDRGGGRGGVFGLLFIKMLFNNKKRATAMEF